MNYPVAFYYETVYQLGFSIWIYVILNTDLNQETIYMRKFSLKCNLHHHMFVYWLVCASIDAMYSLSDFLIFSRLLQTWQKHWNLNPILQTYCMKGVISLLQLKNIIIFVYFSAWYSWGNFSGMQIICC